MRTGYFLSVAAAALVGLATAAPGSILTFDLYQNAAGQSPIAYGDLIPNAYGDHITALSDGVGSYAQGNGFTPNIAVDYRHYDPDFPNPPIEYNLAYGDAEFGDLFDVAYNLTNGHLAEITLIPEDTMVRLNSFDLAYWTLAQTPAKQVIRILDHNQQVLFDYSAEDVPHDGLNHVTLSPDITSSGPLTIQFGQNYNLGIDNVNFDQVPEPATLSLLALAAPALLIRRKK